MRGLEFGIDKGMEKTKQPPRPLPKEEQQRIRRQEPRMPKTGKK